MILKDKYKILHSRTLYNFVTRKNIHSNYFFFFCFLRKVILNELFPRHTKKICIFDYSKRLLDIKMASSIANQISRLWRSVRLEYDEETKKKNKTQVVFNFARINSCVYLIKLKLTDASSTIFNLTFLKKKMGEK